MFMCLCLLCICFYTSFRFQSYDVVFALFTLNRGMLSIVWYALNCRPEAVYRDLRRDKEAEYYHLKFHRCWNERGDCVLWQTNKAHCPHCRFNPAQWSDARFCCLMVAESTDMIYCLLPELVDNEKEWEKIGMGFWRRNKSNIFKGANKFKIQIVYFGN